MKKIEINPGFEAKLKKLKIKTIFLKNCRNPKWIKPESTNIYRKKMNETKSWSLFIVYAFPWPNTPEGYEYWQEISEQ